jgi:hypothetical protein
VRRRGRRVFDIRCPSSLDDNSSRSWRVTLDGLIFKGRVNLHGAQDRGVVGDSPFVFSGVQLGRVQLGEAITADTQRRHSNLISLMISWRASD